MAIEIYKSAQGRYTRWGTFAAAMLIGIIGARNLSQQLVMQVEEFGKFGIVFQYGIPVLFVLVLAGVMFWVVAIRRNSAEFLIDAQKVITVNSPVSKFVKPTRSEVWGLTKVVVVTMLIIAAILFGIDVLFILLFRFINLS